MAHQLPSTFCDGFHDAAAVARMPYQEYGTTGCRVSKLGIGGSAAASVFGPTNDETAMEVLVAAIRQGVNVIDTAPWYGHGKSEILIGKALKTIPRSAVYVHSKVGRYAADVRGRFDFSAARVRASVDESLQRLGLEYIDCMQVHDPEFALDTQILLQETIPALEEARQAGKVKRIGVTGYDLNLQRSLVESAAAIGIRVDSCLTYCHYTLNDTTLVSSGFMEWAQRAGVGVMNASPLGMGLFTSGGPPPWHPASPQQKKAVDIAKKIASSRGYDISSLAMKFALSCPGVPCTLFSTAQHNELASTLTLMTSSLSCDEVALIRELQSGCLSDSGQGGVIGWHGVEVSKYWMKLGQAAAYDGVYANAVRLSRDGSMLYECVHDQPTVTPQTTVKHTPQPHPQSVSTLRSSVPPHTSVGSGILGSTVPHRQFSSGFMRIPTHKSVFTWTHSLLRIFRMWCRV